MQYAFHRINESARLELQEIFYPKPILPEVYGATCDELIAAGWGNFQRHLIPEDWRIRQPTKRENWIAGSL